jgi:hypothetical protein
MCGLKMIVSDFIHPPALGTMIGCLYFNTIDMGLAKATKKLWAL